MNCRGTASKSGEPIDLLQRTLIVGRRQQRHGLTGSAFLYTIVRSMLLADLSQLGGVCTAALVSLARRAHRPSGGRLPTCIAEMSAWESVKSLGLLQHGRLDGCGICRVDERRASKKSATFATKGMKSGFNTRARIDVSDF
jgi:hypothetical protein